MSDSFNFAIVSIMKLTSFVVGPLSVNCFIIRDDQGTGVIIDPGSDAQMLHQQIARDKINLQYIINTHGHFDHIGANRYLKEKTGAKILIHEKDAGLLKNADIAAARFGLTAEPSPEPDTMIDDGDIIEAGDIRISVLHTPGHSPGGVSLLFGDTLFTGDTLFAGSIGRTDLPGGSIDALISSVREKIFTLSGNIEVLAGHGPSSSVAYEKDHNPFFNDTGVF